MELRKPKGLGNQQLRELLEELRGMARRLRGEVMVLELAQHVQTFLHAYNQPPAKSFYEQMLTNKRKQEEKQQQEQQRKMELLKKKEEKQVCGKIKRGNKSSVFIRVATTFQILKKKVESIKFTIFYSQNLLKHFRNSSCLVTIQSPNLNITY